MGPTAAEHGETDRSRAESGPCPEHPDASASARDPVAHSRPGLPDTAADISRVLEIDAPSGRRGLRRVAIVAGVGTLVAAAYLSVWGLGASDADTRYEFSPALRAPLEIRASDTGRLEPTEQVDVSSELSGIVRRVLVDRNDPVTQGQRLAELDTARLEADIAQARASLTRARASVRQSRASLRDAERALSRTRQLFAASSATELEVEQAETSFERAQAGLQIAQADVAVSEATLAARETDLVKTCICSPIDGVVLMRNVDPGQTVAATFQAPVLFTVAKDLRRMQLEVDVDEADVSLVAPGQLARFGVDAYPDRSFEATLTMVSLSPDTAEGVVTYRAYLSVDNTDLALRPGMTATAEIRVRELAEALVVPNEALRFEPPLQAEPAPSRGLFSPMLPQRPRMPETAAKSSADRRARHVFGLADDGSLVELPVAVGLTDGTYTEVIEGDVTPGQALVVGVRREDE